MDRIPPELLDRIFSHINFQPPEQHPYEVPKTRPAEIPYDISPLSTISRQWQHTIERRTFRSLLFAIEDLDNFDQIVIGHRRRYLKELRFNVQFPDYDDETSKIYETNEDRAANNAMATSCVRRLFSVLSAWGARDNGELSLRLEMQSPGDRRVHWVHNGLQEKRFEFSYIELEGVEDFPEVHAVTSLWEPSGTRPVELRSQYGLASRVPKAKSVSMSTYEPGIFLALRRELRERFLAAVDSWPLHSPQDLCIEFHSPPFEHDESLPNMIAPYAYDRVNTALRQMSLGSTTFHYYGIMDPTLLWPSPAQGRLQEPYWANLKNLELEPSADSPSGKWYFRRKQSPHLSDEPLLPGAAPEIRPPGHYETEEENLEAEVEADERAAAAWEMELQQDDDNLRVKRNIRDWPNDETMRPLLAAFARAIGAMPALRHGKIEFSHGGLPTPFRVSFAPPGGWAEDEELLDGGRPVASAPRVVAHAWGWEMGEEVEGLFREAGVKVHGVETVVRYLSKDVYTDIPWS